MEQSLCHTGLNPILTADTFAKAVAPNPIRGERNADEKAAASSAVDELIKILSIYGLKCKPLVNTNLLRHHKNELKKVEPPATIPITSTLELRDGRKSNLYCSCCCCMTKVKLFLVTVCEFKLQKIKSDTSRGEESVGGGEDATGTGDGGSNDVMEYQYELILLNLFPHSCPQNKVLSIPKNLQNMGTGWIIVPFPVDVIFGTCYQMFTDKLDDTPQSGKHHGEI